jgi:diguanylate cyclase (GGDEF)-like protein
MLSDDIQPFVSFIGVVLQFAGSLLLAVFFLLLRPYARRRRYFVIWGWSWIALTAAIAAVAFRYYVQPVLRTDLVPVTTATRIADFLYQTGKFMHFSLLAVGTAAYVGAVLPRRLPLLLLPVAAVVAFLSVLFADGLNGVLVWQAPMAIALLGFCAIRVGSLPPSRHGLGSHITAAVFAIMAVLWLIYFFAFGAVHNGQSHGALFFQLFVRYNTFFDILMAMLLGFGMIVILMEDAKREVDDAKAELGVAHNNLRRAALYDTVTGSLNRRAYAEGVGLETARAGYGAVMMFDLDDLKRINDSYGHSAGDALLCHLTDALRAELRPSDKLYRWGGDEFLLVLPGADASRANARLRRILAESAVLHLGADNHEVRLNVSMGSAPYASAEKMQQAIDAADAIMYREKHEKKQRAISGQTDDA